MLSYLVTSLMTAPTAENAGKPTHLRLACRWRNDQPLRDTLRFVVVCLLHFLQYLPFQSNLLVPRFQVHGYLEILGRGIQLS
jgi:hypothetical protein